MYSAILLVVFCCWFAMVQVRGATRREEQDIVKAFCEDLNSLVYKDEHGVFHPVVCAVCDGLTKEHNEFDWIDIDTFEGMCKRNNLEKRSVEDVYPKDLIAHYTVPGEPRLLPYVLSPKSVINVTEDRLAVCKTCAGHLQRSQDDKRRDRTRTHPPPAAIINGYLIGEAPDVLKRLNAVELALVSTVRISCQSWIFFGGCHQHVKGWHCFYQNRHEANVANLANLTAAGLQGRLLVVLCGPFTSTQRALTLPKTSVDPQNVINAYEWLKKHNYHYKDVQVPAAEDIPIPVLMEEN